MHLPGKITYKEIDEAGIQSKKMSWNSEKKWKIVLKGPSKIPSPLFIFVSLPDDNDCG